MNRIKEVLGTREIKQDWLVGKLEKSCNMVNSYVQNLTQLTIEIPKLYITLFFLFVSTVLYAQINIDKLNIYNDFWVEKGDTIPFTGEFFELRENGDLLGNGFIKNGKAFGKRTTFHTNGKLLREWNYIDGKEEGLSVEYYDNGTIKQKGFFKDGKEEELWKIYYKTGICEATLTMKSGVRHGEYMEFDESGDLVRKLMYTNDKADYHPEFHKFFNLAREATKENNYSSAIKYYNQAVTVDKTVAQAYFNRAVNKEYIHDRRGAYEDYLRAIENDSTKMEAYSNCGGLLIKMLNGDDLRDKEILRDMSCTYLYKAEQLGDTTEITKDLINKYCIQKIDFAKDNNATFPSEVLSNYQLYSDEVLTVWGYYTSEFENSSIWDTKRNSQESQLDSCIWVGSFKPDVLFLDKNGNEVDGKRLINKRVMITGVFYKSHWGHGHLNAYKGEISNISRISEIK